MAYYQSDMYHANAVIQIVSDECPKYVTTINPLMDMSPLLSGFTKIFSTYPNFPLSDGKKVHDEALSANEKIWFENIAKTCNLNESMGYLIFLNCVFVGQGLQHTDIEMLFALMDGFGSVRQFVEYYEFLHNLKTTQATQTFLDELIIDLSITEALIIFGVFKLEKNFFYQLKSSYQLTNLSGINIASNNTTEPMDFEFFPSSTSKWTNIDVIVDDASTVPKTLAPIQSKPPPPTVPKTLAQSTAMITTTPTTSPLPLPPTLSLPLSYNAPVKENQTVVVNDNVGSKKKREKKSNYPKKTITPEFYKLLKEQVGFTDQLLERASNPNGENYIVSGNLVLYNNHIFTIQKELQTNKKSTLYFKYNLSSGQLSKHFSFDFEFVCEDGTVDTEFEKFEFLKEKVTEVERALWCFEHSVKRLDANEKSFSIRITAKYNGVQIDSVSTPLIGYANTTKNFSQPSSVLLGGVIIPFDLGNTEKYDPNEVAVKFYGINDVFKGISTTNSSMPLEVLFEQLNENNQVSSSYTVHQNISKTDDDNLWRFNEFSDQSGNIIHFLFSNVVEFSLIIPKGKYRVTFRYCSKPTVEGSKSQQKKQVTYTHLFIDV